MEEEASQPWVAALGTVSPVDDLVMMMVMVMVMVMMMMTMMMTMIMVMLRLICYAGPPSSPRYLFSRLLTVLTTDHRFFFIATISIVVEYFCHKQTDLKKHLYLWVYQHSCKR